MRIIVAVPLVAVVGFAGVALAASARQADQSSDLGVRVQLAADAGALAYQLQRERATAADLLTAGGPAQEEAFGSQAGQTDGAIARYRVQRSLVRQAPGGTAAILTRLDRELDAMPSLRAQVRTAAQASVSAVTFSYRIIVADLLAYREATAQGVPATDLADDIRAAAAVSRIAESIGQEQVAVLRAVAAGQLTPAMQQDITAARTGFTEASLAFLSLARQPWRVWWEQAGSGAEALTLQRLQDQVSRTAPGSPLRLDTQAWIKATQQWAARLFEVQQRVDATVLSGVAAAHGEQQRRALAEGAAMAVAILLTLTVTWAVARQITRRLRRLRDDANTVAFAELPTMVAELRVTGGAPVDPEELARTSAPEPEHAARDEIGEVAQAFTAVHRAAVHTAAEQAVMRANTAEIFIHLSRREQRLVDAVLAQVDRVEKDETDPERLDQLYTLDHLATRMARINASLLVLGGVGVGRVRNVDVPLADVLQAALSQIEHYRRVRLGMVDDDVAVVPEAVDEVVHMLAELMDNATTYSPPDTEAWATARCLGDRVIVQVGDEGVGLPAQRLAQLNQLLATPPATDVAAIRAMGLVVVGQLATRLGAAVELRAGPKLGTIAEVTLPGTLIRPVEPDLDLPVAGRPPAALTAYAAGNGHGPNGHGSVDYGSVGHGSVGHGSVGHGSVGHGSLGYGPNGYGNGPNGNGNGRNGNGHLAAHSRWQSSAPAAAWPQQTAPLPEPITAWPEPAGPLPEPARPPREMAATQPLPTVNRPARPAPPAPAPVAAVRGPDQTQELPIFQQVNNWFSAGLVDEFQWRSPADEGWQTATEAAAPEVAATTARGLPKRVPQKHLVPGAIDAPGDTNSTLRRDPNKVAAAMSAYARGVAARRPVLVNAVPTDPSGSTS